MRQSIVGVDRAILHNLNDRMNRKAYLKKYTLTALARMVIWANVNGIARCIGRADGSIDLRYECNGSRNLSRKTSSLSHEQCHIFIIHGK